MNIIYADYNIYYNSIDICTYAGYILRIDCGKAEEGAKPYPNSECALNALAIDNPHLRTSLMITVIAQIIRILTTL